VSIKVIVIGRIEEPLRSILRDPVLTSEFEFCVDGRLDEISQLERSILLIGHQSIADLESYCKTDEPLQALPSLLFTTLRDIESSDWSPDVADDFIVVPCTPLEIKTRLLRLALRYGLADDPRNVQIGNLSLDERTFSVRVLGKDIKLSPLEYQLLRLFMTNVRKVFTREEIAAEVWGQLELGDTRTVDVHVSRLRTKLGPDVRGYIRTVKNIGYGMFIPHGES
jgi:hypothetical protein